MEPFLKESKELLEELGTSREQGLSKAAIEESREKHGSNVFTKEKGPSLGARILNGFKDPMILILLGAVTITIGVNVFKVVRGEHAEFVETVGIMVAILISIVLTLIMEGRSEKAFEALNKIKDSIMVKCQREGKIILVPQKDLVVGDIVFFETGDKIPVDCRLFKSRDFLVDESSLTGESEAVTKNASLVLTNEQTPLAERLNMVYSGTFVAGGQGEAVVTAVGDKTEFGKIAKELSESGTKSTPLQEKLGKLGKTISIIGIAMASIIFLIQFIRLASAGGLTFDSVSEIFINSIVLIVASVPEGLPTVVAITLALNVIKMAKEKALVKKMVACETIGSVNIICSDKTGTLTENKMTVESVFENKVFVDPKQMGNHFLIKNICLNSSVELERHEDGEISLIGNPTEGALVKAYEASAERVRIGKSYEDHRGESLIEHTYQFSSEEKRMTTIVREGSQVFAYSKGAPEKIFNSCTKMLVNGEILPFNFETDESVRKSMEELQSKAMRVLAFSHSELKKDYDFKEEREQIEVEMIFDGFVAIRDPIRKEVFSAVEDSFNAGISIKMLTGDNKVTATAIASELGIINSPEDLVFDAAQIDEMDDEKLASIIDRIKVISRSAPLTKLRVVKMLKARGNVVAVTGDGVNDAPALKNADVGIAMGITGTEVSKEASDVVLLDDSFSTVVKAVKWGRGIYENFQRFIQFQLTANFSAVVTVMVSIILGLGAPFTALQLLWINLVMDGPPAITLGLEPVSETVMDRQPTKRDANIITKGILARIIINGLLISLVFMGQNIFGFIKGTPEQAGTILFSLFVLFQLFNAFNCRALGNESIVRGFFANRLMLLVFAGTFALQIFITQFGNSVFKTVPLSPTIWLQITLCAFSVVILSEAVKLLTRTFKKVFS